MRPWIVLPLTACTGQPAAASGSGEDNDTGRHDTSTVAPTDSGGPSDTSDTSDTAPPPGTYPTVDIEPGSFTMGSPEGEAWREDWETTHVQVITRPFSIGLREVTQGEFLRLLGENPSAAGADGYGEDCAQGGVDDALPAACATWFQAVALANALSHEDGLAPAYAVAGDDVTWDRGAPGWRLPTEAEWEYAARAGSDDTYGVTADSTQVCVYANVADDTATANGATNHPFPCDDGAWHLTPPQHYQPNAWGIYDTLGNVYEWTWDWSGTYPSAPIDDYAGPDQGTERVRRGGGWHSGLPYARPAYRGDTPPDSTLFTIGVRLVKNR